MRYLFGHFQLMSHLEIHDESKHNIQLQKSLVPTSQPSKNNSTQKLLQDTIDEALSGEPMVDAKSIQFHSCNKCSLTFLNEQLYMQHMKMHATSSTITTPTTVSSEATGIKVLSNQKLPTNTSFKTISALATTNEEKIVNHQYKLEKQQSQEDGDLESIFEKMHSETETITTTVQPSNKNKQIISKSENYTSGGITFNISIPQDNVKTETKDEMTHVLENTQQGGGIDMPALEEDDQQQQHLQQQYNREEIEAQVS
jgi:zinc finger protein 423